MGAASKKSIWILHVREMLESGLGVEDIALKLNCDLADVRREVEMLRESGAFKEFKISTR